MATKTPLFVRKQAGGMFTVVDESMTTGDIWFVDSGSATGTDGAGYGQNPDAPCLTLDYAIGLAAANNGDRIYLMPGHAETLATAGAITIDKAGLQIIGLGEGADRPTFTFSAVDATMLITAASVKMSGVLITPSIDSVVSPIVISAADADLDIEVQDESATVECVRAILTTAAADRLKLKIRYRGFIAGNACVNVVRLVGCDTADIELDVYGEISTAIVEFHTTACHDIRVAGNFYNDNTALSKNVVDTVTGSTWTAEGFDGKGGYSFSGGSAAALASDDVAALATIVGTADSATTDNICGKIGTDTEMADNSLYDLLGGAGLKTDPLHDILAGAGGLSTFPAGAVAGNDVSLAEVLRYVQESGVGAQGDSAVQAPGTASAQAYLKGVLDVLYGATGLAAFPAAALAANDISLAEVIRMAQENLIRGTGTQLPDDQSLYDLVAGANGIAAWPAAAVPTNGVSLAEAVRYLHLSQEKCIEKSDGAVLNGLDNLFDITGGPVLAQIYGIVTTLIGGAAMCRLQITTTTPAATAELNAGAVAIDDDAAGTSYYNVGATSVFTPVTAGAVILDPVTVEPAWFLLPIGTVKALCSAAQDGVIAWYMVYKPLSPSSVVAAAA